MTLWEKDENRLLTDLAINAGRKFLSSQTGLIHYTYHIPLEEQQEAIPLYETFLFILALFKKRTVEEINEAKILLEKLLYFQVPSGSFPVYLHEYPEVKDRFAILHILPIFYWILTEFGIVLGQELKERLEQAVHKVIAEALVISENYTLSNTFKAQLGGSLAAFGNHWNIEEYLKRGKYLLKKIDVKLFCPQALGGCLLGMQLYPEGSWEELWANVQQTWHLPTLTFAGPSLKDFQMGFEPQVSLYDFFMGYYSHLFSKRALTLHPVQLQAALIQPMDKTLTVQPQSAWSLTTLSVDHPLHPCFDRGRQAVRLIWGDASRCHTFVCEGGNVSRIDCQSGGDYATLLFYLGDPLTEEEKEKKFELQFFVDVHEEMSSQIEGKGFSVFYLGDTIDITSSNFKFSFVTSLVEGSGDFMGHLSRGNRPSQNGAKGANKFAAFDWVFGIRTLRRSGENCCLKTEIKIHK